MQTLYQGADGSSGRLCLERMIVVLSLFSVVTIGFDATAYTFTESDSTVSRSVRVSVQSGSLARSVVVTVQTMDGTATGGNLINTQAL